jgi:hypothetical protein
MQTSTNPQVAAYYPMQTSTNPQVAAYYPCDPYETEPQTAHYPSDLANPWMREPQNNPPLAAMIVSFPTVRTDLSRLPSVTHLKDVSYHAPSAESEAKARSLPPYLLAHPSLLTFPRTVSSSVEPFKTMIVEVERANCNKGTDAPPAKAMILEVERANRNKGTDAPPTGPTHLKPIS